MDCDVLIDVDVGAADSLVDPAGAVDWLVADDAADWLWDSDGAVEVLVDCDADPLVEADAADSDPLADVDVDADVDVADCEIDSVADSLVGPVLPGARTALPSVARVCVFAAVTS